MIFCQVFRTFLLNLEQKIYSKITFNIQYTIYNIQKFLNAVFSILKIEHFSIKNAKLFFNIDLLILNCQKQQEQNHYCDICSYIGFTISYKNVNTDKAKPTRLKGCIQKILRRCYV